MQFISLQFFSEKRAEGDRGTVMSLKMEAAKLGVVVTLIGGPTKCQGLCRALEEPHPTFKSLPYLM